MGLEAPLHLSLKLARGHTSDRGVLSAFWLNRATLEPVGEIRAPHAHTVSVDPRMHRVYQPLESIGGRPLLRIYEAAP